MAGAETAVAVVSLQRGAELSESARLDVLRHLDAVDVAVVRGTPAALRALSADRRVRSVSPDLPVRVTGSETGTGTGQLASESVGGAAGQAGTGAGVTVAVVDTGVSDTPYLNRTSGRLVDGINTAGGNDLSDGFGHGTAMANLVAGGSANGGPAIGIAPAARVLNVKVAGADGTTSLSKVIAGLDYVIQTRATHGTKVLSISLSTTVEGGDYIATPLTDAVDRVRESGVVVLAAVGNTGGKVGAPAYDPGIIAVGAADTTSKKKAVVADFSATAVVEGVPRPDFVAAGVGVRSVLPPGSKLARDHAGSQGPDGFWRGTGTSQATAVAAGAAAAFLARFPAANVHETRFSLMAAARPVDGTRAGSGLVRIPARVFTPDQFIKARLRQVSDAGDVAVVDSWSAGSWSGSSWSGSSWSGSSWSGSSWSGSSWSGSSWSGSSWSGSSWSGSSWSGSSWSTAVWAAGSWSLAL